MERIQSTSLKGLICIKMNFVKTISSEIDNLNRRVIKFLRLGKEDFQTSLQVAPHGIDSNPVRDMVAIYGESSQKGKTVIIGYLNREMLAVPGETRVYSTDSTGALKGFIWLKSDGTYHFGGDADNLVRFSKLKEVVDELQNDLTTLKQVFTNWVPVPNDGGAALKSGSSSWAGTPLTKNIDASKIDEFKTL